MAPHPPVLPIAVIGGGITGLTAAWHLQKCGQQVTVFEAALLPGGAIRSHREGGWLHEAGPNSLLEGSASVATFIDAIGVGARRIYAAEAAKNRYVVRDAKLIALPASPVEFLKTRLFSTRAKLRLLGEPFRSRSSSECEESVATFVERRLGREFLDYAINPFVGGVYAGDPRQLSVRHAFPKLHALEQKHGSLLRGALKQRNARGGPKGRIFSFPEGLAEIPRAIVRSLGDAVWLSTRVKQVRRAGNQWEITSESRGAIRVDQFSSVICALPADALAGLNFKDVAGAERLSLVREIKHPPVVSVFTGFRRKDVLHPLDGFGLLVPELERRNILGTLFSSTLFPDRAPEDMIGLTTFVGGVRSPELASLDDAALALLVGSELRDLLGANGEIQYLDVRRSPRAIPQYTLGYERFQEFFSAIEAGTQGYLLAETPAMGSRLAIASNLEYDWRAPHSDCRNGRLVFRELGFTRVI